MAIRIHILGRLPSRQAGLIGLFLLCMIPLIAITQVSLDSVEGINGREVILGLAVSELPQEPVYSLYTKLSFDQSALELREVRKGAAMPESWSDPLLSNPPIYSIAAYGTSALEEEGVLLQLRFGLIGNLEDSYPVTITYFGFDEEYYPINLVHGGITTLNRIPFLQDIAPITGAENQLISFELIGSDPQNLPLYFTAQNLPSGAELSPGGSNSAIFAWTPSYTQAGSYDLAFELLNSQGYGDTLIVQVEVEPSIRVHIPFGTVMPGDYINIPVYGQDFDGMEVYSVFSRIQYDPQLLAFDSVIQDSSLSNGWPDAAETSTASQVNISLYGTSALQGSGPIFYLRMQAVGELHQRAYLHFAQFVLNEGNPTALVEDGFVFIGGPEPWFDDALDVQISEGELLELVLQAYDPRDLQMQIEAISLPQGATLASDEQNEITITWQTDHFDYGDYQIVLRATNTAELSAELEFNVQVANVPVAPIVVNPLGEISFAEDTGYAGLDVSQIFDDGDIQVGDVLSYSADYNPYLELSWDGAIVSIWPLSDWYGSTQLCFTATDLAQNNVSYYLDVSVLAVNDPPRLIAPIPMISIPEDSSGHQVELSLHLEDVEGDALSYSVAGADNIQISFDGSIMTIIPQADWNGSRSCILTATELNTAEHYNLEIDFDIVVLSINDSPVILQNMPPVTMMHNTSFYTQPLELYFDDIDSDLSYELTGTLNISAQLETDNRIRLEPQTDWYGTEYLTVKAIDDSLAFVEQSFRISVIRDFMITEDFDHEGSLPAGWLVNTVSGSSNWVPVQEAGSDYAMRVQNPNASTIYAYRLMSPAYNLSQYKDIEVCFDYTLQGANTAIFQYSTTGITWSTVATISPNSSGTAMYSIPAIGQQSNVRFRWSYQTNSLVTNYWKIDDLQISGIYGDFVRPGTIQDLTITEQSSSSVSLAWTPPVEEYFERYEIYYSTDDVVNTQDPQWSISEDPELAFWATDHTTITGLSIDTEYWFMIRAVDSSANIGLPSNSPNTFLNVLPVLHSPYPEAGIYHSSRTVNIGITATDDVMLSAASISYRADINGNGSYDEDEVWTPVPGLSNAPELEIRIPVSFAVDGDNLQYEFRVMDLPGRQYVYSGTNALTGIEDDYSLLIDSTPPLEITDLRTVSVSGSTVNLSWSPSYDLHFTAYEVYYSDAPDVDETALAWTLADDPTLASMDCSGTQITGLSASTSYWFRVAARDLAGNLAVLSNEVTNVANSDLPVMYDPYPAPSIGFVASRTVEIGTTIHDAYGIDLSRIHYRYDANANGIYDPEESWAQVQSIEPQDETRSVVARALASFDSDGDSLAFEFRCWDIDGYGPAYSGTNALMGFEDDWTVAIDTISPAPVENLLAGALSQNSLQVAFSASSDEHFYRYEIYYDTNPGAGLQSSIWTSSDDPILAETGSGTILTTITGLQISTRYYLRVRAVDLAGNDSWSEEVNVSTFGAYPPAAPANFNLEISGSNVILSWDPVTTNSVGDPMSVAAYLIYGSTEPYFEADFGSLLDVTEQNFYVFEDIAAFIPFVFFRVSAIDQLEERQSYPTRSIPDLMDSRP